jgi:hypothetical protein
MPPAAEPLHFEIESLFEFSNRFSCRICLIATIRYEATAAASPPPPQPHDRGDGGAGALPPRQRQLQRGAVSCREEAAGDRAVPRGRVRRHPSIQAVAGGGGSVPEDRGGVVRRAVGR